MNTRVVVAVLLATTLSVSLAARRPIVIPTTVSELDRLAAGATDRIPLGAVLRAPSVDQPWEFLGPLPIEHEYWSGDTFASGRISAIVVNPTNAAVVYMAAAQGGVWKSTDAGANWVALGDRLSSLSSGALALEAGNPSVLYYGTGEQHYSGDSYYGDGLFRSTDAGATWSKVALKTAVGSYIARVLVRPDSGNVLFVASDRGLLQSSDRGQTWIVRLSQNWCNDVVVSPLAPLRVFAGIHSTGVFRSTDGGYTWAKLASSLPTDSLARVNLVIAPSDSSIVYASFVNGNTGGLRGMYKTTDCGDNWVRLDSTPNYLGGQGWYDNCLAVHPSNPNVCYAGGVFPYDSGYYGVIRTTDGGSSWVDVTRADNGSQLHPDQHILAFGPDSSLWVGNDGGIWRSKSPEDSWVNCNRTLGVTQFFSVALHPTDSSFLLGGNQDNGTERYEGRLGWPQVVGGDGGPSVVEWDSPNIYYTTYVQLRNLAKWDDGVYVGDVTGPWTSDRADWCNGALIADPNQPNTILAGTYRVFRSTNSGGDWTQISGDLTGGGNLRTLAVAGTGSDTIYSGSSDGRLYLTTNATDWDLRNSGLPAEPIPDIVVAPGDYRTAYVCVDRGSSSRVFATTDAGVTWTNITGDLATGLRGMSLAAGFGPNPPELYLGTDYGVYASTNGGANWIRLGDSLPDIAVCDIACDSINGVVVAATHGRGMWRLPVNLGGVADSPRTHAKLGSVSGVTLMRKVLAIRESEPGGVLLDVSGRPLMRIAPGPNDVSRLPSGIYYLRSTGGEPSAGAIQKFVIVP
jgi:photosystem II stability/assembly factor-like uncharacterized protein